MEVTLLGALKRMEDDGIKIYKITEGAEQVVVPSEEKEIVFRSDAPFKEFHQVMLNGLVLDKKYYSVKEGSTVVTLNADFAEELKEAEAKILELQQQIFSREEFRKHMDTIRATLEAARRDAAQGMVTVEWVNKYIDKILSTPEDDGSLRLDIKIFSGETTQKYLANLRSRTGHMFKKMVEAYEKGLQ